MALLEDRFWKWHCKMTLTKFTGVPFLKTEISLTSLAFVFLFLIFEPFITFLLVLCFPLPFHFAFFFLFFLSLFFRSFGVKKIDLRRVKYVRVFVRFQKRICILRTPGEGNFMFSHYQVSRELTCVSSVMLTILKIQKRGGKYLQTKWLWFWNAVLLSWTGIHSRSPCFGEKYSDNHRCHENIPESHWGVTEKASRHIFWVKFSSLFRFFFFF